MNTVEIRQMQPKDRLSVEHICIETAPDKMKLNARKTNYTLLMYNRYYTRKIKHSFVAVDCHDNPIGYILCAPDFNSYYSDFSVNELEEIKKQNLFNYMTACCEIKILKKYSMLYPAHLHIDILPEYQGRGIGFSLVQTLVEDLKSIKVPGLMLSVSSTNIRAVAFYKKCGFEVLFDGAGIVFGMRL